MNRRSNALVFAFVFTLACADWLVERTTAQPGENQEGGVDAAAPAQIPPLAFLTGPTQESAVVAGLEVKLDAASDGEFALVFHNPSAQQKSVELEVDCMVASGSPMSRIGPVARLVHSEHVAVSVPAGVSVRRVLAPIPGEPNVDAPDPSLGFASFSTTSFRLRAAGARPEVAPLAVLRSSPASI